MKIYTNGLCKKSIINDELFISAIIAKILAMRNFFMACASLFLFFITVSVCAQINIPDLSSSATIVQRIGLDDITIKYFRPNVKGRKIFGGIVPYNQIWRTGANNCTRIIFTGNMEINNIPISAGEYSLFTIPSETEWTIILNKNTTLWGAFAYSEKEDILRFKVTPVTIKEPVETFEIRFQNVINNSALMQLVWGNILVAFPISEAVDSRIMTAIKKTVIDSMPNTSLPYFQAASYYFNNNKDINQAYSWVNKAISIDNTYFYFYLKSQIEAKQLRKKEAKETAAQGLELSKKANSEEYIKLFQKFIQNL